MAAKRIPNLDPLSGAASMNDDKFVVFDTSEGASKRMDRSQVGAAIAGDLGGASGSFVTVDGKAVFVEAGLITGVIQSSLALNFTLGTYTYFTSP